MSPPRTIEQPSSHQPKPSKWADEPADDLPKLIRVHPRSRRRLPSDSDHSPIMTIDGVHFATAESHTTTNDKSFYSFKYNAAPAVYGATLTVIQVTNDFPGKTLPGRKTRNSGFVINNRGIPG